MTTSAKLRAKKAPAKKIDIYVRDAREPDGFKFDREISSHNCHFLMCTTFGFNKAKDGRFGGWHIKVNGEYRELPWKREDAGILDACGVCDNQLSCMAIGEVKNFSLKHAANDEAINT